MNQGYGQEAPARHHGQAHRRPARYLVLIEAGGASVARLYAEDRSQLAEYDAGAAEVAWLTTGRPPSLGALLPDWDQALRGHSRAERAAAEVYALDT